MYLILRSKYFQEILLLFTDWNIYPENASAYLIWITWFQKELATPRFKIPHMNFKKEILVPFRKILVPFRTTKDCHYCRSLFLVWHMGTLNWDLDMDSFVGTFCIRCDGLVAKYLHVMQRGLSSNLGCYVYIFFIMTSLGARFKSGFHISFWDYVVPDRIPWVTLELYDWNLGTSFG
jgi:hypothetical protein